MGHLDTTNSRDSRDSRGAISAAGRADMMSLFVIRLPGILLLSVICVAGLLAQSGRNQDKTKKSPQPRPKAGSSPRSDSGSSPNSTRPSTQKPQKEPAKTTEEVDEDEVVRVSSNLVPIPASVVDPRGIAITSLKLEDFELRVDGQVKPISDMTRLDTSVKLVMLFDNS